MDDSVQALRKLTNDQHAEFREGQREAIDAIVIDKARVIVVQRTGWGHRERLPIFVGSGQETDLSADGFERW